MSTTPFSRQCRRCFHERGMYRGFARSFATHVPNKHRLAVAIVLNRAPLLTRTPTKFERAFYKYQARIQRALHNPFPYDFYFKPGSILEKQFSAEERTRERKAFGKGFVEEGEKDEASENSSDSVEEEEGPLSRRNAADELKDVKSLDRLGARNLYLLLKGSPNDASEWRFPKGDLQSGEFLHQAAQRQLVAECGPNMKSWIVGRRPIGLFEQGDEKSKDSLQKVFFFKGHIFSGQVQPPKDGITDFAWLTKQEVESRVSKEYWLGTKDMLSDL